MLTSLTVKNFAIIDNIQIDFKPHMSVLTGETGAGKSLIIDAIGLLFGDRASVDLVRHNESKATIEGIFDKLNSNVLQLIKDLDIDLDDEFLVIKREIYDSGKSICKINGSTVSLSTLQEISSFLGDIHTQFDAQKLINPKNYLNIIDNDEINDLVVQYKASLSEYNQVLKKLNNLKKANLESTQKLDFYKYQISELTKANISLTEEDDLKARFNVLNNHEKIIENIKEFNSIYNEDDVLDKIYTSISNLSKIEKFDPEITELKSQLEEHYYALNDCVMSITAKYKDNDFDISELDQINNRLAIYSDLKRKYRLSTEELIDYLQKITKEVNDIDNYDYIIEELSKQITVLFNKTLKIAQTISEKRKIIAKNLEQVIISSLVDLQLKDTKFVIEFKDNPNNTFYNTGIDEVDFLVTFNKGEPLKQLSKTASGGELSRFMLAVKANIAGNFTNQTLIFDEIDNGVSGSIAYSIASKIKSISKDAQVLCVTHLPQVAASANTQLKISKSSAGENRTTTSINELSMEERIIEIAKMISNGDVTTASINLAKELLNIN